MGGPPGSRIGGTLATDYEQARKQNDNAAVAWMPGYADAPARIWAWWGLRLR